MSWVVMKLRNARVFARCDDSGELVLVDGRVEVRYKARGSKAYGASPKNLVPIPGAEVLPDDHCDEAEPAAPSKPRKKKAAGKASAPEHEDGAIIVYADGACSGNPGPSGLGVVILQGEGRRQLSEYLGHGTNNIAELTGILRAAEALAGVDTAIRIHTDSRYSIGVLTQGWKAKKNPELIARAKAALSLLSDVELRYVPGHAGVELNELADSLARKAVEKRASTGWFEG